MVSDSPAGIPMTFESERQLLTDEHVLSLLAYPVCHGDLRVEASGLVETRLACATCGHGYPVLDGIPVLTGERALKLRSEDGC